MAYEELFLALQQGTVDGQENPIVNIDAISLDEVQDYLSLSAHGSNSNLVIVGEVWGELSSEQQEALQGAARRRGRPGPGLRGGGRAEDPGRLGAGGAMEIVDDVDIAAFQEQADAYLRENFDEEQLAIYEGIRETAE